MNNTTRAAVATAAIGALLIPLAGCGNTAASSGKTELTVWSWDTSIDRAAEAFMKANPDITVKVSNVGSTEETYTALNNAAQAGNGLPDVTLIEYLAIPQFVHSGTLMDLSKVYDTAKLKDTFTPGTWSSVNINGGLYAMPADSGPMAYFYNKDVFYQAGVNEPPTTWDEFYEDAKKIRATGSYITSDSGDAGLFNAMMWAMGGHAYTLDGEKLTIDITGDKGAQRFMDLWQKMRDEDLIDVHTKTWTDDWMKSLGDSSVASLISGAWMANNLLQGVPQATGKFRVALLPTVDGTPINGEYGGSGLAIAKDVADGKLEAAKKFVEYVTTNDEGIDARVSNGSFPATTKTLNQEDFLAKITLRNADGSDNEFFGGQKYNEVFSQAAKDVTGKWEFLPFEPYARSIYTDDMGPFFSGKTDLKTAAAKWQKAMKDYAEDQGFIVR
ncbi:extracellular solute-binding protein [Bifidobacterium sp. 82T10]|uniref:Extracellular solute-binding protein n=1 Tax=Bifidobacterium miconis TaxID=2834435 RepID=A0ABS6WFS5_9BIFI|nr:extracellular solute-binding protein [Bifidobacterium miconis]MBW3092870.1 extracellular solute-binding protein [Bifidobacterium miconis]